MKQLILFDIDGTILYPGTLARELMNEAVLEFTGKSPDLQMEDVAGFTDPSIMRKALGKVHFNRKELNSAIDQVLHIYIRRLKKEYPFYAKPRLYEDAVVLINRCRDEGWHIGILTGNLRAGAQIKLERFNIWDRFDFGVFGDDGESREDLLWQIPELAWENVGEAYTRERTVLVGDTPNDARVASLHGVRSLIVCRHPEWKKKIQAQNPTVLVDSFEDIEPIMSWLVRE